MKRAILYTRVSTDEQADRGYSLRDQESRLREYCRRQGIEAVAHYCEDASAKTFDRPEFEKLLAWLKANRGAADTLLVVKWDRFSRNATDALGMIRTLEGLGVSVQAVEQPIDRSVPEQLMMLAIYVAAPEVENQRRGLNTKMGMRRAMREGRWCNRAPKGYRKAVDERGKPVIVPDADAEYVREAFQLASESDAPMEEIRKRLWKQGFRCSKNQFTLLLRNPVYMGKILLPAWRDEPEELVRGLHEPLVSEDMFRAVQRRFERDRYGRKQRGVRGRGVKINPDLILRGHLLCVYCGGLVSGSMSRGNGGRYGYYYCHRCTSGYRVRADEANAAVVPYLKSVSLAPEVQLLYGQLRKELVRDEEAARQRRIEALKAQVLDLEEKLLRADEAYIEGKIAADSYGRLKAKYARAMADCRRDLELLNARTMAFAEQLEFAVRLLSNLGGVYERAEPQGRHALLVRIFPDHLVYRDGSLRTSPESKAIALLSGKTQKMKDASLNPEAGVLLGSPNRTVSEPDEHALVSIVGDIYELQSLLAA